MNNKVTNDEIEYALVELTELSKRTYYTFVEASELELSLKEMGVPIERIDEAWAQGRAGSYVKIVTSRHNESIND